METIYVAQSRCGLLKVGRTTNPDKRLLGLRKEFKRKGAELARFEPCEPTTNGWSAEKMLIDLFAERLPLHSGREWFIGGQFENAVRAAREISDYVRETAKEVRKMSRQEAAADKAKWDAYWAPIRAKEQASRIARLSAWREKEGRRAAVRQFRATVCERMAITLLHGISDLAEPPRPSNEPPSQPQGRHCRDWACCRPCALRGVGGCFLPRSCCCA